MKRAGRGLRAEAIAAWWLRAQGYAILYRRYATPVGEVDVIARGRRTLILIEVKHRQTLDDALHAIRPAQRRRIERAAGYLLAARPDFAEFDLRFDVVAIAPWRLPRHLKAAWEPLRA